MLKGPSHALIMITTTCLLLVQSTEVQAVELDGAAVDAIQRAGNVEDDAKRLKILREIQQQPDLPPEFQADLNKLVRFVQRWVDADRLHFFAGPIYKNRDYDFGIEPESPLYPLTALYRGRAVFAATIQSGNIWSYPDRRAEWFATAREFFQQAHAAFPQNRIVRMYLGEPIPWKKDWPRVEAAPQWAVDQRAGLQSIAEIIEWWIDHRMQENGEYGGGWGDDCEMWRWWVPAMIAFQDPKITAAQRKFSEALMSQPHMKGGYMSRMTDVEHSAEDSTDSILPMMHLSPDDKVWRSRARRLAELMRAQWTGRNERGFLQFKSTYFTVDRVHDDPQKACDTPYHVRAIQPALLYWQRTGDADLTTLFSAWMDMWVDATAREENGKPAGVIPAAVHWPEGTIGGLSPDWWFPRNHGEPTLYEWPSAMGSLTDALLLTYHMTGNEKYLQPIRSMARIRLEHLENRRQGKPGSQAWCGARMGFLNGTLAKYRVLTGDKTFDELLQSNGSPYLRFRLQGERSGLKDALNRNKQVFAYNFERYTSEVRWTDRVLRFPAVFRGNVKLAEPQYEVQSPNPRILYSTATGDPGSLGYFPLNAVRWQTPSRDIAALVAQAGASGLRAELFHFGAEPREMGAEFYLLDPGPYRLVVHKADRPNAEPLQQKDFSVDESRTRIDFTIPARTLCTVQVRKR